MNASQGCWRNGHILSGPNGLNGVHGGADGDIQSAGVAENAPVSRVFQTVICGYVVYDFAVGGKPDLFSVLHQKISQGFDALPIVVAIKFIGVAPNVKQGGAEGKLVQKFPGQVHKLRVVVVTGGIPG